MLTNNEELLQIKKDKCLSNEGIATLLDCSESSVKSWSNNNRAMPTMSLKYLKLLLGIKILLKEAGK